MTPSRQHPSTFLADELQRALREQSFGIAGSHCLPPTSQLQATAVVTLLEGSAMTVVLTPRGYHIARPATTRRTFESIEQLLGSVSGLYERRRQEVLIAKLKRM